MPVEFVGSFFIQIIFELAAQILGYFTSRILLPMLSFGYISVAPVKKGVKVKPRWHDFNSASNGKIIVHEEMAALLGLLFWLVVGVIIFIIV